MRPICARPCRLSRHGRRPPRCPRRCPHRRGRAHDGRRSRTRRARPPRPRSPPRNRSGGSRDAPALSRRPDGGRRRRRRGARTRPRGAPAAAKRSPWAGSAFSASSTEGRASYTRWRGAGPTSMRPSAVILSSMSARPSRLRTTAPPLLSMRPPPMRCAASSSDSPAAAVIVTLSATMLRSSMRPLAPTVTAPRGTSTLSTALFTSTALPAPASATLPSISPPAPDRHGRGCAGVARLHGAFHHAIDRHAQRAGFGQDRDAAALRVFRAHKRAAGGNLDLAARGNMQHAFRVPGHGDELDAPRHSPGNPRRTPPSADARRRRRR